METTTSLEAPNASRRPGHETGDDLAIREVPCSAIQIGLHRHRKEMGDIESLADSIAREGLLQPIGLTGENLLVFGARRLRAVRDVLQRPTIQARIVHPTSILAGEYAENELRKNFTVSELVAIADAISDEIPERRGRDNLENFPELKGRLSRDIAAEKAGLGSGRTYEKAKRVVDNGIPRLLAAMDSGEVSIDAAALIAAQPRTHQAGILALPLDERRKAIRGLRASGTLPPEPDSKGPSVEGPSTQPDAGAPASRHDPVAKRRMIDALSQIRGHCRGLSELDASAIRHVCSAEEIATWVEIARKAAGELRLFSRKLAESRAEAKR